MNDMLIALTRRCRRVEVVYIAVCWLVDSPQVGRAITTDNGNVQLSKSHIGLFSYDAIVFLSI